MEKTDNRQKKIREIASFSLACILAGAFVWLTFSASSERYREKKHTCTEKYTYTQTLESRIILAPCNTKQAILIIDGKRYCSDYGKPLAGKKPYEECECNDDYHRFIIDNSY
jgi:heme/copper-type cytochrome/quinol oxidase subunit 2